MNFIKLNSEMESLKTHTHTAASASEDGFMTAAMLKKHDAIHDYIIKIEKGSNYYYREWASGIKELWQKSPISTNITVPWGGWYIVGPLNVSFSKTFSEVRSVQLSVVDSTDVAWVTMNTYNTLKAQFYLARGDILTSAKLFEVEVYVIGM